ncbi:MAG: hypothetical protein M1608_17950, partial [Candidatus Omnitrophica bacterium]|nr:hypothetical protein [Candidatus Omnitrophota bacterium]
SRKACLTWSKWHFGTDSERIGHLDSEYSNALRHSQTQFTSQGKDFTDPQKMRGHSGEDFKVAQPDLVQETRWGPMSLHRIDQDQRIEIDDFIEEGQAHLETFPDFDGVPCPFEAKANFTGNVKPDSIIAQDVVAQA